MVLSYLARGQRRYCPWDHPFLTIDTGHFNYFVVNHTVCHVANTLVSIDQLCNNGDLHLPVQSVLQVVSLGLSLCQYMVSVVK